MKFIHPVKSRLWESVLTSENVGHLLLNIFAQKEDWTVTQININNDDILVVALQFMFFLVSFEYFKSTQ